MQAIKDKLSDMNAMRKVKAEAKAEENAEKELAKTRVEVAKEVRMAKEAEAAMDLHVQKAAEKVADHEAKITHDIIERDSTHSGTGSPMYGSGASPASGHNTASMGSDAHNKFL